jgi:6-phosphogluconate dehydrogenase
MIGLGRMGASMVRRLIRHGHECVVRDLSDAAVLAIAAEGATPSTSLADFTRQLQKPRTVWLMVPAGVVDATLEELVPCLDPGDIVARAAVCLGSNAGTA